MSRAICRGRVSRPADFSETFCAICGPGDPAPTNRFPIPRRCKGRRPRRPVVFVQSNKNRNALHLPMKGVRFRLRWAFGASAPSVIGSTWGAKAPSRQPGNSKGRHKDSSHMPPQGSLLWVSPLAQNFPLAKQQKLLYNKEAVQHCCCIWWCVHLM